MSCRFILQFDQGTVLFHDKHLDPIPVSTLNLEFDQAIPAVILSVPDLARVYLMAERAMYHIHLKSLLQDYLYHGYYERNHGKEFPVSRGTEENTWMSRGSILKPDSDSAAAKYLVTPVKYHGLSGGNRRLGRIELQAAMAPAIRRMQ